MTNQIVPRSEGSIARTRGRVPRALARELAEIEGNTAARLAVVRGETIVAREKLSEIDYLAWKAMTGHAMLAGWANHLAGDNPALMEECRFFLDMSRLAKAEVISDAVDKFRGM